MMRTSLFAFIVLALLAWVQPANAAPISQALAAKAGLLAKPAPAYRRSFKRGELVAAILICRSKPAAKFILSHAAERYRLLGALRMVHPLCIYRGEQGAVRLGRFEGFKKDYQGSPVEVWEIWPYRSGVDKRYVIFRTGTKD